MDNKTKTIKAFREERKEVEQEYKEVSEMSYLDIQELLGNLR